MKASTLIRKLQRLQEKYGDMHVTMQQIEDQYTLPVVDVDYVSQLNQIVLQPEMD